jgi:hypothetical protein
MRGIDFVFALVITALILLVSFNMFSTSMKDDSIREFVAFTVKEQIREQGIPTEINNPKYVTIINGKEMIVDDGKEEK